MVELTGNKCYGCGSLCYSDHEIKAHHHNIYFCSKHCCLKFYDLLDLQKPYANKEDGNMIIIFNGDTLALLERLQQFSGKSQKVTLDFMLENFKTLEGKGCVLKPEIWEREPVQSIPCSIMG